VAWWTAAPGSPYASPDALTAGFPHLAGFLARFTAPLAGTRGADDLATLQQVIDGTLALIDPRGGGTDGTLAVLAGRPLAVVRSHVCLELDGPALTDPSWRYANARVSPDFVQYDFDVRLGDLGRLGDGLVGYFTDLDYDQFNAVYVPDPAGTYAVPIGPGNFLPLSAAASATYATLLVDPRAPVHATSDVLPLATLSVPPDLVRGPLSSMEVTFRAGPLLATTAVHDDVASIVMPQPPQAAGEWTWEEWDGAHWRTWPIAGSDQVARLPATPTARTGVLKLDPRRAPDS
jgi:hypothetical protein